MLVLSSNAFITIYTTMSSKKYYYNHNWLCLAHCSKWLCDVFAWLFPLYFSYALFLMLIAASVVFKLATIACWLVGLKTIIRMPPTIGHYRTAKNIKSSLMIKSIIEQLLNFVFSLVKSIRLFSCLWSIISTPKLLLLQKKYDESTTWL